MWRRASLLLVTLIAWSASSSSHAEASAWEREIVYQIFPRSFRDSTGDRKGDLKGILSKLDFLQETGYTALLLNPVFASRTYHNYFADDFFKIDPDYGTNDDFFELVREARRRGIKVLLDMEVQYVADGHPWFRGVREDSNSEYRHYLWREGSAFYGLNLPWYDQRKVDLASINPDHPEVLAYFKRVFRFWMDPNGDGNPSDGVDGFRIDHMMDDLDNKGVKTGMLRGFWQGIIQDARRLNPRVFFVGEQADWGYGRDLFAATDVDGVFALPLLVAISAMDRERIRRSIAETSEATPPGRTQLLSIENHDVNRFASMGGTTPALARQGAVLNLTLKGTPMIYYGQELGMRGRRGSWNTDGNDIPIRLAYRWNRQVEAPGSPVWYKDTGPWWSAEFANDEDGLSLEEQADDPQSLFRFYRRLIAMRLGKPSLREGTLLLVESGHPALLAYLRESPGERPILIVLNFSDGEANTAIDVARVGITDESVRIHDLWADQTGRTAAAFRIPVRLEARGFRILEIR
jgi:alpha-amylase